MNLGAKVLELRSKRNMSQGDLADALNVSRQSVSKWETNSSVPELDKLLKMSEIFAVSLDELVHGTKIITESPNVVNNEQVQHVSGLPLRKIIGLGLLGVGFIIFAVLLVVDFLAASILSLPFIITGVVSLLVSRHTILSCSWALYVMLYMYFRSFTTLSILYIFNIPMYQDGYVIHLTVGWIMAITLTALVTRTLVLVKRKR